MRKTFFTDDEIARLRVTHAGEVIAYAGVSHTQLSIARHRGGAQLPSGPFTYIPETDELIRDDVLQAVMRDRRTQAREAKRTDAAAASQAQLVLI